MSASRRNVTDQGIMDQENVKPPGGDLSFLIIFKSTMRLFVL